MLTAGNPEDDEDRNHEQCRECDQGRRVGIGGAAEWPYPDRPRHGRILFWVVRRHSTGDNPESGVCLPDGLAGLATRNEHKRVALPHQQRGIQFRAGRNIKVRESIQDCRRTKAFRQDSKNGVRPAIENQRPANSGRVPGEPSRPEAMSNHHEVRIQFGPRFVAAEYAAHRRASLEQFEVILADEHDRSLPHRVTHAPIDRSLQIEAGNLLETSRRIQIPKVWQGGVTATGQGRS